MLGYLLFIFIIICFISMMIGMNIDVFCDFSYNNKRPDINAKYFAFDTILKIISITCICGMIITFFLMILFKA